MKPIVARIRSLLEIPQSEIEIIDLCVKLTAPVAHCNPRCHPHLPATEI